MSRSFSLTHSVPLSHSRLPQKRCLEAEKGEEGGGGPGGGGGEDDEAWDKLPDDYALLPLLLVELKGPAFAPEALAAIAAAAAAEKVTRHVALFVASDAQLAAARDAGFKGPLIRAFMVRGPAPPAWPVFLHCNACSLETSAPASARV